MARPPRKLYTAEDEEKILTMRKAGKSFDEIGEELDRDPEAIRAKMYAIKYSGKPKAKFKKETKVIRRPYSHKPITAEIPATPTRPMIALVGNPHEVTATIKELFS